MYNWLFFKIYDYYKSKNNNDPSFNSSLLVFFAQLVHFAVLVFGISKIFHFNIPWISADKATNKIIFIPFLYLWSVLVSKFYKNKAKNRQLNDSIKPINFYQFLLLYLFLYI